MADFPGMDASSCFEFNVFLGAEFACGREYVIIDTSPYSNDVFVVEASSWYGSHALFF